MRLLLDAHALLWWLAAEEQLSEAAYGAIETAEYPLVGAGTLMEIAIKRSLGKLEIDADWPEQVRADGFGATTARDAPQRRAGGIARRAIVSQTGTGVT